MYESELCETRQEKRIACEQLEALSEDFAEMQGRAERAEANDHLELSKKVFSDPVVFHLNAIRLLSPDARAHLLGLEFKEQVEAVRDELAKREKALEQLLVISTGIFGGSMEAAGMQISDSESMGRVLKMISIADERYGIPELAEWLKQGEKK
jgi:hypothetical protein